VSARGATPMLAQVPATARPSIRGHRQPAIGHRVTAFSAVALGLIAAGILLAPPPARSWGDGAFSAPSERELVDRTNRSRAGAGLAALQVDAELTATARWRSKDMADRDYFSHSIPPVGGRVFEVIARNGYCFTLAGENIGWNTFGDQAATDQIHEAFLASPGHRANIMSERWDEIGVGAYKGPDGKKLWTVLFADACEVEGLPPGS
jgi:uncharacterized protein YkwD